MKKLPFTSLILAALSLLVSLYNYIEEVPQFHRFDSRFKAALAAQDRNLADIQLSVTMHHRDQVYQFATIGTALALVALILGSLAFRKKSPLSKPALAASIITLLLALSLFLQA